jgi:hypothetical protein
MFGSKDQFAGDPGGSSIIRQRLINTCYQKGTSDTHKAVRGVISGF